MVSEEQNQLFDLIELMLNYDPNERITLKQALEHPFFDLLPQHLRIYDSRASHSVSR